MTNLDCQLWVIFGQPGMHIVMKHAKNMQSASQHQIVQLPLLQDS